MKRRTEENGVIAYKGETYTKAEFDPELFLGKTTVVAGNSESGKSYILNSIISCIAKHVRSMMVFSASAGTDKSFPMREYTLDDLIRTGLDIKALQKAIESAEEVGSNYQLIMTPDILEPATAKLFARYGKYIDQADAKRTINSIKCIKKAFRSVRDPSKDEVQEYNAKLVKHYKHLLLKIKSVIIKYKIKISNPGLETILSYVSFNPHFAIVINDLTDEYRALSHKEKGVIDKILNRGRHVNITFIILIHTWTDFSTTIRNSAPIVIFTNTEQINQYVSLKKIRGSEAASFYNANEAILAYDRVKPKEERQYYCVLYLKKDGKFHYIQADKRGIQVFAGASYLLRYRTCQNTKKRN